MNDIETRDAAAFLERYPNASDDALEAHLSECRVRRFAEWATGLEVLSARLSADGVLHVMPKAYPKFITIDVGFAEEVLRG